MCALFFTRGSFPTFSDRQISLIFQIFSAPVISEEGWLSFDALAVTPVLMERGKSERAGLLAAILALDEANVIDGQKAEGNLVLRKLVFYGIFGAQIFARDMHSIGEYCALLMRLVCDTNKHKTTMEYAVNVADAIAISLAPFAQKLVDRVPEQLFSVVLTVFDNHAPALSASTTIFFEFLGVTLLRFPGDRNGEKFASIIKKVEEYSLNAPSDDRVWMTLMLMETLALHDCSMTTDTRCTMFGLVTSMMKMDEEVRSLMHEENNAGLVGLYLARHLRWCEFEVVEYDQEMDMTDRLAGLKQVDGPIERTLSEDFRPLDDESRPGKVSKPARPGPTKRTVDREDIAKIVESISKWSDGPAENLLVMAMLLREKEVLRLELLPYFVCHWLSVLRVTDFESWVLPLHEGRIVTILLDWAFITKRNDDLQDYVVDLLVYMGSLPCAQQPFYFSEMLLSFIRATKALQLEEKQISCIVKCAQVARSTFVRGCQLIGWVDKMTGLLTSLYGEPESETKLGVLRMIDTVDSFPLVFQYLFESVEFCGAILTYLYDSSTRDFALAQLSFAFEQLQGSGASLQLIVEFLKGMEFTGDLLVAFLKIMKTAVKQNKLELETLFEYTDCVEFLATCTKKCGSKKVMTLFIDLCSSLSIEFDMFSKLDDICESIDEEMIQHMWRIVFDDDEGMARPRAIANPGPLTFLFRVIMKDQEALNVFLDFIVQCMEEKPESAYDIVSLQFPSQLLNYMGRYRSQQAIDETFSRVVNLFRMISMYCVKPNDIISLLRLCTSLPGHIRPRFALDMVDLMTELFGEFHGFSSFFRIDGDVDHIQLPVIPLEVVNNGFAIFFDMKLLQPFRDISGTILELSGRDAMLCVRCEEGQFVATATCGDEKLIAKVPKQMEELKWLRFAIVFTKTELHFVIDQRVFTTDFEKMAFSSNFGHFQVLRGVPCHVASIIGIKDFSQEDVPVLMQMHRVMMSSFHPSENGGSGGGQQTLFHPDFRKNIFCIFNARSANRKFAVDLIHPSTAEITGAICQTSPRPSEVLSSIGSVCALLPLLGQLEQPVLVSVDGATEYIFDPELLPRIINLISMVLQASPQENWVFDEAHGFGMIGFLLSLTGSQYMNDRTVSAICQLFRSVEYPWNLKIIEDIMFNFRIWIYAPTDFQVSAYGEFYAEIEAKLRGPQKGAYLAHFNVSRILVMIRVFLWDTVTNQTICIGNEAKAKVREEAGELSRPEDCRVIREFFWSMARSVSEFGLRTQDVADVVACCCEATDQLINAETLAFFVFLVQRRDDDVMDFLRASGVFGNFMMLIDSPGEVVSRIIEIFVVFIACDTELLKPYSVAEWVAVIMATIIEENINEVFIDTVLSSMVEGTIDDDGSTTGNLIRPQLIPLFLQSIVQVDEENMIKYLAVLEQLVQKNHDTIVDEPFIDRTFLLFLVQRIPVPDTEVSAVVDKCLDILCFLYRCGAAKVTTAQTCSIALMPKFMIFLAAQTGHDFNHITRMIFVRFFQKFVTPGDDMRSEVFVAIQRVAFRFITEIPSIDTYYRAIKKVHNEPDVMYAPTLQELFHASICDTIPEITFVFATRTTYKGVWIDYEFAKVLTKFILDSTPMLSKLKTKEISSGDILALLIGIGVGHAEYHEWFMDMGRHAIELWSQIPHQKRVVASILGNVVRAKMRLNTDKKLDAFIFDTTLSKKAFIRRKCKIDLPKMTDLRQVDNVVDRFGPIVEMAVAHEDHVAAAEVKAMHEEYLSVVRNLIVMSSSYARKMLSQKKTENISVREMSESDKIRVSLEQSATIYRQNLSQAAKRYRMLYDSMSTDSGPWHAPEERTDNHRKLGTVVLGNSCRFLMKRNSAFSNHEDASRARDSTSSDVGPEECHKEIARLKMTEFRGDFALVAAMTEKKNAHYIDEQVVLKCDARYVTIESVHSGTLSLTEKAIFFDSPKKFVSISLRSVRSVFRRLCLLLDSAVEIFTTERKSYFIDFSSDQRKLFLDHLASRGGLTSVKFIQHNRDDIDPLVSRIYEKWREGKVSNFALLMKLNKYSGRSYNDLSQYPVFPWVISDYRSDVLNLNDTNNFRDLSKPIGALTGERLAQLRERVNDAKLFAALGGGDNAFLYGSLYSSAAVVIGYLIRMEPFTTLHVNLQSGRFDHADRLFVSIPDAWESVCDAFMDFRELTPEFYYFPDFLMNENENDFGSLVRTNEKVSDVILPPWAANAREFIVMNRIALESPCVTAMLPRWIDLLFGPKARLPDADAADNIFHPYFYESALDGADERTIAVIKEYTACFGSIPLQLFKETPADRVIAPHPFQHSIIGSVSKFICKLFSDNGKRVSIRWDRKHNAINAMNSSLEYSRVLDLHPLTIDHGVLSLPVPSELAGIAEHGMVFAMGERYAIVAVPWDSAFVIFEHGNPSDPKYISRMHNQQLTCVGVCDNIFATASKDCSLCIWRAGKLRLSCVASIRKHATPVRLIDINRKLRMCVSVSQSGRVVTASTLTGEYMRTLELGMSDPSMIAVSDFGYVAVAYTQPSGCLIKIADQNLVEVCEKLLPVHVLCWTPITWDDGAEYLIMCLADGDVGLYRLPFVERVRIDITVPLGARALSIFPGDSPTMCIIDRCNTLFIVNGSRI